MRGNPTRDPAGRVRLPFPLSLQIVDEIRDIFRVSFF